jgi:hypothetical protein
MVTPMATPQPLQIPKDCSMRTLLHTDGSRLPHSPCCPNTKANQIAKHVSIGSTSMPTPVSMDIAILTTATSRIDIRRRWAQATNGK